METSKKEYIELFEQIFVRKEPSAVEDFQAGIRQIASGIELPDGTLHCFAPLVLYFIFTRGTKPLLQGRIRNVWSEVRRCSKAVRVSEMTELSGRKAGVNLVLYQELLNTFQSSTERFDQLLQRLKVRDELPVSLGDIRKGQRDVLDFLFNLTTGYGALFHCRAQYGQVKNLYQRFIVVLMVEQLNGQYSSIVQNTGTRWMSCVI